MEGNKISYKQFTEIIDLMVKIHYEEKDSKKKMYQKMIERRFAKYNFSESAIRDIKNTFDINDNTYGKQMSLLGKLGYLFDFK